MSEALFPEILELRRSVRAIVEGSLKPLADQIRDEKGYPPELIRRFVEAGFLGVRIDPAHGGAGMDLAGYCLLQEELGRVNPALSILSSSTSGLAPMAIQRHGTPEQKARYLPTLTSGEGRTSFALTEPEAGSDAGAIRTRALRVEGGWVLNGMKHFITCAEAATVMMVIAVTDPALGRRGGITAFLVDKGAKGLNVSRVDRTIGTPAWTLGEVVLDDCHVADSQVLGAVGRGFDYAMESLDEGRLNVASICIGAASGLLEDMVGYATTRRTFGAPLSDRQAIQWMIADSATDIAAARSLVQAALAVDAQGGALGPVASMAKLFASEMAFRVADRALQVHGGAGLSEESRVGAMFRDLRIFRIGEGASEIQRMLIARQLIREAQ